MNLEKYVWPFRSWIVAAALVIAIAGAVDSVLQTRETAVEARAAAARAQATARLLRASVCVLVQERRTSIEQLSGSLTRAKDFLRAHPKGAGDISRADIQASIDSIRAQIAAQQGTIRAFRLIPCE